MNESKEMREQKILAQNMKNFYMIMDLSLMKIICLANKFNNTRCRYEKNEIL